jgi:enoyl-CoA hydratase/carnithine racemase
MSDLLVEKHDHVTIWTMNRPHRMNALGGTLRTELEEAVREFEADPEQHVAILTSAGSRALSAGRRPQRDGREHRRRAVLSR